MIRRQRLHYLNFKKKPHDFCTKFGNTVYSAIAATRLFIELHFLWLVYWVSRTVFSGQPGKSSLKQVGKLPAKMNSNNVFKMPKIMPKHGGFPLFLSKKTWHTRSLKIWYCTVHTDIWGHKKCKMILGFLRTI